MSECSKYQLLLQTEYVRLREKYDQLYIYSHILSYISLRESSQLYFETKDSCPVEFLSTTVSQEAIVLQQPSEYSTG